MLWPTEITVEHLAALGLVLTRTISLCLAAPLIGPFALGIRIRVAAGIALALLIAPLTTSGVSRTQTTLAGFLVAAGGEALIGLSLGLGVRTLFVAMHAAGQVVGQMSGLQLSEVFSPGAGGKVPILSQLLFLVTTAVFLIIGGHRRVIEALLDTFAWLPPGHSATPESLVGASTALLSHSFALGVRTAAPAIVALLLATLILGMLSRVLPQLNLLSLGFGINVLVAIAAVGATLSGAAWLLQSELDTALRTMQHAFASW
ncbi:MAG: type III secretion protein [Planctomycetota bacterium]|nr:MAG: type III secretion protein [Planctomycetota bacterium]